MVRRVGSPSSVAKNYGPRTTDLSFRRRHQKRQRVDIGLEQSQPADNHCQKDTVPEDCLEDVGLLAQLMGGRGGDADALSVDHLPHYSPRAVGRANQNLRLSEAQMLKSSGLE